MKTKLNIGKNIVWAVLPSRMVIFLAFQAIIALIFQSWEDSQTYWLLSATLTNTVSIILLVVLFRAEGKCFFSIFNFKKHTFKKDLAIFSALLLVAIPLVMLPNLILPGLFGKSANFATEILFKPLNNILLWVLLFLFPISIGLAELSTYFMYVMPKLKSRIKSKTLAILLPVIFLSIQHCTLPLVFDLSFIALRALVFLPFAAFVGISTHKRPSLFPFFVVLHVLLDMGTVAMFFIS
ncbi:MAG: hypothetical protein JXR36_07880 [Bacteroidales bacterium]|nr:hypothetical protein [Bacteroidales bacterium]